MSEYEGITDREPDAWAWGVWTCIATNAHASFCTEPSEHVERDKALWLVSGDDLDSIVLREVAKALERAREDIRERRRIFVGLHADQQYINALDDAFGLVNNRLRDAKDGAQS